MILMSQTQLLISFINNMQQVEHSSRALLQRLSQRATALHSNTIQLYRQLHLIPEIGLEEHRTSQFVRSHLTQLPGLRLWEPLPEVPTAVVAELGSHHPQQTILLRCELDALPFKEASGLPFAAKGQAHHACGHDGHIAALLTAARMAAEEATSLGDRRILLVFQPGEEGKQGARKLVEGCPILMEVVHRCYALHLNNTYPPGWVLLQPGAVTALSNRFCIKILGKAVHCLCPEQGIDANLIGCILVPQLYALVATTVPPLEGGILVITHVQGGKPKVATVSDYFQINGSIRTFSIEVYNKIKQKINAITTNLCHSYGATSQIHYSNLSYQPVFNDPQLTAQLKHKLLLSGEFQIADTQKCFAGEDFSEFSSRKPSCFVGIGSAPPGSLEIIGSNRQSKYNAHSPLFRFDEDALLTAVKLWMTVIFT